MRSRTGPIRVMVVEDSPTARNLLVAIFNQTSDIQVVGTALDGVEAVQRAAELRPDVITMDIHMPRLNGLEATRQILQIAPIPIVIVTSTINSPDMDLSFTAMRAGALSIVKKPVMDNSETCEQMLQTVRLMAEVPVVRRWNQEFSRRPLIVPPASGPGPTSSTPSASGAGPAASKPTASGAGPAAPAASAASAASAAPASFTPSPSSAGPAASAASAAPAASAASAPSTPAVNSATIGLATSLPARSFPDMPLGLREFQRGQFRVVGIASSTGGPSALVNALKILPADFPVPILLVQHITRGFAPSLAEWLNGELRLRVRLAEQGETPPPGVVLISPDDRHMQISDRGTILLHSSPPYKGLRPSANYLFFSLARVFRSHAVGIILTGMGDDGVEGLSELHNQGGLVVAQDEATSVVYGMPREAAMRKIVDHVLPIDRVGQAMLQIAGK